MSENVVKVFLGHDNKRYSVGGDEVECPACRNWMYFDGGAHNELRPCKTCGLEYGLQGTYVQWKETESTLPITPRQRAALNVFQSGGKLLDALDRELESGGITKGMLHSKPGAMVREERIQKAERGEGFLGKVYAPTFFMSALTGLAIAFGLDHLNLGDGWITVMWGALGVMTLTLVISPFVAAIDVAIASVRSDREPKPGAMPLHMQLVRWTTLGLLIGLTLAIIGLLIL